MNISEYCIRKPVATIIIWLLILGFGFICFFDLKIDLFPNVDFPVVVVKTVNKGAAPTEMESSVTKRIEDSLSGISGIKYLYSETTEGSSVITLEFEVGTNIDRALQDVRDQVSRVRRYLPDTDSFEEPVVSRMDPSATPIEIFSINSSKRTPLQLTKMVEDNIAPTLQKASGVGDIQVRGAFEREVEVYLNNDRLRAYNLSAIDVCNQINVNNVNSPSGKATLGSNDALVRTIGSAETIEKLKSLKITLSDGSQIPLSQIARVEDSYEEQSIKSTLNGVPSVNFYVTREQGTSIVAVDREVRKQFEEVKKSLPDDVNVTLIHSLADYIEESNTASHEAIWHGTILAIIVILYFLRDKRATFISGMAIPFSMAGTYIAMFLLDQSFNFMTLLGLALVVGILVDDAIVDLENIVRHVREGKTPFQASIEATDEIGMAVVACTLTIVAVFFPMAFMKGMIGQFFKAFGIVVSVSVLLSLAVARTITPTLASILLKARTHEEIKEKYKNSWFEKYSSEKFMEKVLVVYEKLLTIALNHRKKTVLFAIFMFIFGIVLVGSPLLKKSFMSHADRGIFNVSVDLPDGSSLEQTQQAVGKVYRILSKVKEVKDMYTDAGSGQGSANTGSVGVLLVDKSERKKSIQDIKNEIRPKLKEIPGAKISMTEVDSVSGKSKPAIQLILSGDNFNQVSIYAEKLTKEMSKIKSLSDVMTKTATVKPEWDIKINYERLSDLGVNTNSIAQTLSIATQGAESSKFIADGEEFYVRTQFERDIRNNINEIENLEVPSSKGFLTPIKTVADFEAKSGPAVIKKKDRKRYVLIQADLNKVALSDALNAIHSLDVYKNMPKGIYVEDVGQAENQKESFTTLSSALFIGIIFIYVILAILFESFIHPLTIMISLPLAVTGAFFSLVITGKELNLMSFIGFIVLMGIVTKNSILLLEYTIKERQAGLPLIHALIQAGKCRIRPILMTSGATIAGLIPIACGLSAGSEVRSPMGVAVIGGVLTSTLLTLIVIPVVYSLFDEFENFIKSKFFAKKAEEPEIITESRISVESGISE